MDEKRFAVLLTDTQDVKIVECDPQEEMFDIARGIIGCDWIELVEPEPLAKDGCLLLIDEEGKLRDEDLPINCVASDLYGSDQHGDPIIGNAIDENESNSRPISAPHLWRHMILVIFGSSIFRLLLLSHISNLLATPFNLRE